MILSQNAIRDYFSNNDTITQLAKVTIKKDTHLAAFKDGSGYLGALLSDQTNKIAGQAVINPITLNPAIAIAAIAVAKIEHDLAEIKDLQKEILAFLVQKEKSELRGDLDFLTDIFNNYKYNWNKQQFKNVNYNKVLDIKQASVQRINFYQEKIKTALNKRQGVEKKLKKVSSDLTEYQIALYLFSFSTFVEVLLLENYNENFLKRLSEKINQYSFDYRKLYTESYNQLEKEASKELQGHVIKGLAGAHNMLGGVIEKIPVLGKGPIDEVLKGAGKVLAEFEDDRRENKVAQLRNFKENKVRPFAERIDLINRIHNESATLIFDQKYLYLENE